LNENGTNENVSKEEINGTTLVHDKKKTPPNNGKTSNNKPSITTKSASDLIDNNPSVLNGTSTSTNSTLSDLLKLSPSATVLKENGTKIPNGNGVKEKSTGSSYVQSSSGVSIRL